MRTLQDSRYRWSEGPGLLAISHLSLPVAANAAGVLCLGHNARCCPESRRRVLQLIRGGARSFSLMPGSAGSPKDLPRFSLSETLVRMETAIEMTGVTKTFGKTTAVNDLDLKVPRGGLYGFIGPNGAGKTTSIRMILSILFPDSGAISVLGRSSALDAKDRIGYLPEERGVYKKMRVRAFLRYIARLKGHDGSDLDHRISEWLDRVGLPGIGPKRLEELSRGMSQKIQFVSAVIHKPDLLILDEPFSGLDPISVRTLRELILDEHNRGATVVFSTHVMPQAEEICEQIVMMHRGRKVLDEALSAIRNQYDPRVIQFEPLDPDVDTATLVSIPEVERLQSRDRGLEITLREGADPTAVMHRLIDTAPAARIQLSRPRLEDLFIELIADKTSAGEEDRLRTELRNAAAKGAAA